MMEAEANRIVYGKTIAELGDSDSRIVVLDADVSKSTNTFHFARRHPERFFNMGSAEQNLISFAAGLATTGKIPFASTFCIFASVRAAEQVRSSVAYPRLNVKIVASNAGVEICGDGPTHQACEDLAIMRVIPNLVVLSPSDPITTRLATQAIASYKGPVYMRLGRQTASVLHRPDVAFEIGRMIRLREGVDLAVIATGHMVEQALLAADCSRPRACGFACLIATRSSPSTSQRSSARPARRRESSRSRTIASSGVLERRYVRSWPSTAPRAY